MRPRLPLVSAIRPNGSPRRPPGWRFPITVRTIRASSGPCSGPTGKSSASWPTGSRFTWSFRIRRSRHRPGICCGAWGPTSPRYAFFRVPTNRGWLRDAGPIFVVRDRDGAREAAICKFRFNAWAKYPDFRLDDELALRLAKQLGFPVFVPHAKGQPVVLEGGAVDVNGQGVVMTTEECLLDTVTQPRNPHLSRAEVEAVLRDTLGVSTVWWLGKGIAGDDTHGHVDDLARFVNPTTLVLCDETDAGDANYAALKENHERAQDFRLPDGSRPEVIRLPMPRPLIFAGQRLPASYANFYIANGLVLVPTFNDPNDRVALGILGECFPNRTVCGIHAVDLVWGLGTLHCLTHEQPAGVPAAPEPAPTSPQGASLVETD